MGMAINRPMERSCTIIVRVAAFFLIMVAATRLTIIASRAETGGDTVFAHWRNAAFGLVGWKHQTIGDREPAEQADFWTTKVDTVLARHPESADLCLGSAWVLDS